MFNGERIENDMLGSSSIALKGKLKHHLMNSSIQARSVPDLGPDVRQDHDRGCIQYHESVVWGEEYPGQRGITDKNPDGEEGDREEVADEDEGFLDQTGQQPNRAANWSYLEVAETATLKSFEVLVY